MSRPITQSQLDILEAAIDKVFERIGIDVEFTRHFVDRLNDKRNQQQITMRELAELFKKEYVRWGKDIARMDDNAEAVMKDLGSALNVPFALNKNGKETELVAKTIMRKKDFKTTNRELPVESVGAQVKGSEQAPKKQKAGKGPSSPHPYRGRLVGENAATGVSHVRDFVKHQRRSGWSVYASRIDHGTEGAHRLEFEKDGVSFEIIGSGETWELFADGPTLGGRGEKFNGLDVAFQAGTHKNNRPVTIDQVRESWEQYQLDEKLPAPREQIIKKAINVLDQKVQQGGNRQSLRGYVFDLYREIDLNKLMPADEFINVYRQAKGDTPIKRGIMSEANYWSEK